jgi:Zn-dependent protease
MQLVMMLYVASTWVLPVLIAVTLHEAAHGFVAHQLGDDTAYRLGRVTFNPLKHIDPFGTILMPAILLLLRSPFLFGYAKPVPVNFRALHHPRRDMVLVAASGPGMNIALATLAALLFHIASYLPPGIGSTSENRDRPATGAMRVLRFLSTMRKTWVCLKKIDGLSE